MSIVNARIELPVEIERKLALVQRRRNIVALGEMLAAPLTVLAAAVLWAMAIDGFLELPGTALRVVLTTLSLAIAMVAVFYALRKFFGLHRARSAAALDVDRATPALEERWSTITELSDSSDAPALRGSEAMIRQVSSEAAQLTGLVNENQVVATQSLRRWSMTLAALALLFIGSLAVSPSARFLLRRFCQPATPLTFTQVTVDPGNRRVARHEPLAISATLNGRMRSEVTLVTRAADGSEKQVALVPSEKIPTQFEHLVGAVDEAFQYQVRAGDGSTPWYSVTPVDRPNFAQIRFEVTPPAYTKLAPDQRSSLPRDYRAVEGSRLSLAFKPNKPLRELSVQENKEAAHLLTADAQGWYHLDRELTASVTLAATLKDNDGLTIPTPAVTNITVYPDQPPTVTLLSPQDKAAAPPDEPINIAFKASDDFGITKAELLLEVSNPPATNPSANAATTAPAVQTKTIPIALDSPGKNVRKSIKLDPAELQLKHGQQLTYSIRVTDSRASESTSKATVTAAPTTQSTEVAKANQPATQPASTQPANSAMAQASPAPSKPSEPKPPSASTPPPTTNMAMRSLPGNSTCSSKRTLQIDEWASENAASGKRKLEIAIDKYLADLDSALAAAQAPADALVKHVAATQPWTDGQTQSLDESAKHVADALVIITDAKAKTANTPYAFMGLQLAEIGVTHVDPARVNLSDAKATIAKPQQRPSLERAAYHIAEARTRLAWLTKQYETVKTTNQLADKLQHLHKMHQLYLEDSLKALVPSKPKLNPMNRKVQEVPDELARQLAARLEEIKKLQKELADAMAKDPELMKRVMAAMRKEGVNLRDVMTVLARRQTALRDQTSEWIDTPEAQRRPLLEKTAAAQTAEQLELTESAAKLDDNMKTWAPNSSDTAIGSLAQCQALSAKVALEASAASRAMASSDPAGAIQHATVQVNALQQLDQALAGAAARHLGNNEVAQYVDFRRSEATDLAIRQTLWISKVQAMQSKDYARASRVEQTRLTGETLELADKLLPVGRVYAHVPAIKQKSEQLDKEIRDGIIPHQVTAAQRLAASELPPARDAESRAVDAYAQAQKTFDELRKLIVDYEDARTTPPNGLAALPTLEELIKRMKTEKKAAEGLLDCKPINVAINLDWMSSGDKFGSGKGASGLASAIGQEMKNAQQRAAERAGQLAQRLAQRQPPGAVSPGDITVTPRDKSNWDTLVSQLQKDLLQSRDNRPPEQYRQAIDDYMRHLSDEINDEKTR